MSRRDPTGVRERAEVYGATVLPDAEVLAVACGVSAAVAADILARTTGVAGLRSASTADLRRVPGLGRARALRLHAAVELGRRATHAAAAPRAAIRVSADIVGVVAPLIADAETEIFVALLLNARHRVIRVVEVARGAVDMCPVVPRDAFTVAVRERAAAIIFAHNHPSGDATPSVEDCDLTDRLVAAGRVLGIKVLDHVIVARGGAVTSLHDLGRVG